MEKKPGIIGLLGLFRESVADLPDGARVAFTGTVGGCPPMSELMAFSVKERNFDLVYIPMADLGEARPMEWSEGVGYFVSQERVDVKGADALVVMGGLAMPKRGRPPEDIVALARSLGNPPDRRCRLHEHLREERMAEQGAVRPDHQRGDGGREHHPRAKLGDLIGEM